MRATTTLFSLSLLLAVSARNTYRSVLTDCLNTASVPILLTSTTGWADEIEPYNLRFTPAPSVVAIPRTQAEVHMISPRGGVFHHVLSMTNHAFQVQSAVKCAHANKIRVSVKGGGHSYGAYGLSGTLVLDMAEFQTVNLDQTTKIATVGAGVRLGNMANKLFSLGKRGFVTSLPFRFAIRC